MVSLNKLLKLTAGDEALNVPLTPEGVWSGELLSVSVGDEKTDKKGGEYTIVRLLVRPVSPLVGVDKAQYDEWLDKGGPDENLQSETVFIRRKRDLQNLFNRLDALGLPTTGRTIDEVCDEYEGGLEVRYEIEYRTGDDGITYEDATNIVIPGEPAD